MEKSHVNNVPVNKIIIDDRPFTADDVLCVAMARLINPDVVIKRISAPIQNSCIKNGTNGIWLADCEYQLGRDTDNIPYDPACGRLYKAWQSMLIGNVPTDVAKNLEVIIRSVDEDTTSQMSLASIIITSFRPCWDDHFSMVDGFKKAVDFVERSLKGVLYPVKNSMTLVVDHLSMKLFGPGCVVEDVYDFGDMSGYMLIMGYANNIMAGDNIAHDIIDVYCQVVHDDQSLYRADLYLKELLGSHVDDPVVIVDRNIPWVKTLMQSKASYAMYQALDGGWNIQCVPNVPGRDPKLRPLPSEWVSNPESRPAGCTLVHPAGIIARFETREDAEAAAKLLTELVQK